MNVLRLSIYPTKASTLSEEVGEKVGMEMLEALLKHFDSIDPSPSDIRPCDYSIGGGSLTKYRYGVVLEFPIEDGSVAKNKAIIYSLFSNKITDILKAEVSVDEFTLRTLE